MKKFPTPPNAFWRGEPEEVLADPIKPDMIKPGAALLDVGITRTDAGLLGDLDPACAEVAGWIAPMPGGTGPMTRAMLLANVVDTAEGNL